MSYRTKTLPQVVRILDVVEHPSSDKHWNITVGAETFCCFTTWDPFYAGGPKKLVLKLGEVTTAIIEKRLFPKLKPDDIGNIIDGKDFCYLKLHEPEFGLRTVAA